MNWLARVYVLPKEEVLDPQGEAILGALRHLDFTGIAAVRSGRLFELHIATTDREDAERIADDAARRLLANMVVETYRCEVMPLEATAAAEAVPAGAGAGAAAVAAEALL